MARNRRSDGMPLVLPCVGCGVIFRSQRRRVRYHSPDCAAIASRSVPGSGPKACRRCGQPFSARQPNATFCSRPCYAIWHNTHGAGLERNTHRLTRRERLAIFDRDHWTCYLCGSVIPPDRKRPDPLAGTLDHIIPVAMNGRHHPSNLAAAHLGCNIAKGDRMPHWWQVPFAVGGHSFG